MWLHCSGDGDTRVRGLRKGAVVWERLVTGEVQRLAVDGGFVAVANSEVHVLQLSDGRLLLPPLALHSVPTVFKLNQDGHLVAVLKDASLFVWNLKLGTCVVKTSLVAQCLPGDVELVGVSAGSGEPFVRLKGGKVLLFHKELHSWMVLTSPELGTDTLAGGDAGGASADRRKPVRLESDLLVAACLGDAELFKEHLEDLCWHFAAQDVASLRRWLSLILRAGKASVKEAAGADAGRQAMMPLLMPELAKLQLDTSALLREVVLPVLSAVPGAQSLLAELKGSAEGGNAGDSIF